MRTKTINLYEFDELSDKAKDKAREWWRECEAQDFREGVMPGSPMSWASLRPKEAK